MNGYDGSLMSSMNAMPAFHDYFNIGKQGSATGFLFAIYTVGQLVGSLFAAPAADRLGRRFGMCSGAFFYNHWHHPPGYLEKYRSIHGWEIFNRLWGHRRVHIWANLCG